MENLTYILNSDRKAVNLQGATAREVVPSDSQDLPFTGALYIGTGGNVRVLLENDTVPVTLVGLAPGVVHPLKVKRVYVTGTTAGAILLIN